MTNEERKAIFATVCAGEILYGNDDEKTLALVVKKTGYLLMPVVLESIRQDPFYREVRAQLAFDEAVKTVKAHLESDT